MSSPQKPMIDGRALKVEVRLGVGNLAPGPSFISYLLSDLGQVNCPLFSSGYWG